MSLRAVRLATAFGRRAWPLSLVCALACAASHRGDADGGSTDAGTDADGAADAGPAPLCVRAEDCRVRQVVASSEGNTCALLRSGAVACWGDNEGGQLGALAPPWSGRPVRVAVPNASRLLPAAGYSCAVTEAGISCWGGGQYDPGLVDTPDIEPNMQIFGRFGEAVDGAAGWSHVCAQTAVGGVHCWGENGRGQLGNGTRELERPRVGPFEVEGLPRVAFVDTGHSHTCALGEDAAVYCWGANDRGQVGDGQGEGFGHREADALSPVRILDGIAQLSVGNEFGCALDVGGGVWCWGWSTNGEVGYPTGADLFSPSPGRVSLPRADRVVDISAGHSNTCAVGESGRVFCWGGNGEGGPLGVGDPNPFVTDRPLEVLDIMTATSVSIGGSHACAIVGDGDLVCWGRNEFGAVGDGTTIDRPVPTAVVGLR